MMTTMSSTPFENYRAARDLLVAGLGAWVAASVLAVLVNGQGVGDAVDAVIHQITTSMKTGTDVRIPDFGTFKVAKRKARDFINLKEVGDWPKYSLPSLTYHEGDAEDLARVLEKLLSNQELRQTLSINARKTIENVHNMDRKTRNFVEQVQQLVK